MQPFILFLQGDPDSWIFIQGLSWLQPTLAVSPTFLAEMEESIPHLPQHASGKAWMWLYKRQASVDFILL